MTRLGRRTRQDSSRDDEGAVAIIVALLMSTVLFVVAAMAVDLGEALTRRQVVQDAADLAALAGAGRLPDADQARQTAVQSLCAQVSEEPDRYGWPATMCTDTSWASDGDDDNGEITVYGPDNNGNGFRDDGTAVTLPNDEVRDGSEDDERLPSSTSAGSAVRVVPPPAHVTFHFATAIGIQGANVDRAATAAMGTPSGLGTPPFYLLPSDLPGLSANPTNEVCLRLNTRAIAGDPARCRLSASALRGYLNEPRNDDTTASSRLRLNVAEGLDHGVAPWSQLPSPSNSQPTDLLKCADQSGTALAGVGHLSVNCLPAVLNPSRSDVEQGLFGTDGRLRRTDTCPGSDNDSGSGGDFSGYDGNSLFQDAFLNPSSTATMADLRDYLTGPPTAVPLELQGVLSSAVLRCPRLLLLPELSVPIGGTGVPNLPFGGASYPVRSMHYLWLGSEDPDNGFFFESDGDLIALHGWLLDPALFSSQVSQSPGLDPYAGEGTPRQVRLVHDRNDDQPAVTPPLGPS